VVEDGVLLMATVNYKICDICKRDNRDGSRNDIKEYYVKPPALYLAGNALDQDKAVLIDAHPACAKAFKELLLGAWNDMLQEKAQKASPENTGEREPGGLPRLLRAGRFC
jgi:hypothetical protein